MARSRFRRRRTSVRKGKFKSRLELWFATHAERNALPFVYEAVRIPYTRRSHYVPDWKIRENVYIETKGYFSPSNRSNLLSFMEQHPGVRIYLFFGNAENRLNAKSKTTYREWCKQHGIECCDIHDPFPKHWWKQEE